MNFLRYNQLILFWVKSRIILTGIHWPGIAFWGLVPYGEPPYRWEHTWKVLRDGKRITEGQLFYPEKLVKEGKSRALIRFFIRNFVDFIFGVFSTHVPKSLFYPDFGSKENFTVQ